MTSLSYDRFKGHASSYDVVDLGYNYRLDDLRASMGLVQFERLPAMNEKRRALWELYRQRLAEIEGIVVPFGVTDQTPNGWLAQPYIFPLVLTGDQDRDRVRQRLASDGIQTSVHYPPVHLFQTYQDRFGYKQGDLPVTEWVASNLITLPFYPSMTVTEVDLVVESVRRSV
jgi:dTDP-4-amino-4,6-dideoxygalactose transaminase